MSMFKRLISSILTGVILASSLQIPAVQANHQAGTSDIDVNTAATTRYFDPTKNEKATISYTVNGPSAANGVQVRIFIANATACGKNSVDLVTTVQSSVTQPIGIHTAIWDGKLPGGGLNKPAGNYCYLLTWNNPPFGQSGTLDGTITITPPATSVDTGGSGSGTSGSGIGTGTQPARPSSPITASVDPTDIYPNRTDGNKAGITYTVNENLPYGYSLKIYDGQAVKKTFIDTNQFIMANSVPQTVWWNGKTDDNRSVPAGAYEFKFRIQGSDVATGIINVLYDPAPAPTPDVICSVNPTEIDPSSRTQNVATISVAVNRTISSGLSITVKYPGYDTNVVPPLYSTNGTVYAGTISRVWNGTDSYGNRVQEGRYRYFVTTGSGQLLCMSYINVRYFTPAPPPPPAPAPTPAPAPAPAPAPTPSPALDVKSTRVVPNPFNPDVNPKATIYFSLLNCDANVTVTIIGPDRSDMRKVIDRLPYRKGGDLTAVWDGKDKNNVKVLAGSYAVRVDAENATCGRDSDVANFEVKRNETVTPPPSPTPPPPPPPAMVGPFIVGTPYASPATFIPSIGETTTIYYTLGKDVSNFVLKVQNPSGTLVETLVNVPSRIQGPNTAIWNGRFAGRVADPGGYVFVLSASNEDSVSGPITVTLPSQNAPIITDLGQDPDPVTFWTTDFVNVFGATNFRFQIDQDARVDITIYRGTTLVKNLLISGISNNAFAGRIHQIAWNGKNNDGRVVPSELYSYVIQAQNRNGIAAAVFGDVDIRVAVGDPCQATNTCPRLDVFRVSANPNPFNVDEDLQTTIKFSLSDDADVTVTILDSNGSFVKSVVENMRFNKGIDRSVMWDGTNLDNDRVLGGNYGIRVDGINTLYGPDFDTATLKILRNAVTPPPPPPPPPGPGFQLDIFNVSANPNPFNPDTQPFTAILYSINAPANISAVILDANGSIVKTLIPNILHNTGNNFTVFWDGTDIASAKVPAGPYYFKIQGTSATAGNDEENKTINVLRTIISITPPPPPPPPPPSTVLDISNVFANPNPFNPDTQSSTALTFSTNGAANITVYVYRQDNTLVKTVIPGLVYSAGTNLMAMWDGTDLSNIRVPAGTYNFRVDGVGAAGTTGTDSVVGTIMVNRNQTPPPPPPATLDVYNLFANPNPFVPESQNTSLTFSLTQGATVTVNVLRSDNSILRNITPNQWYDSGVNRIAIWDGRDTNGQFVAAGTYTFRVDASNPSYGSDTATGTVTVSRNVTLQIYDGGAFPNPFNPRSGQITSVNFSVNMTPTSKTVRLYRSWDNTIIRDLTVTTVNTNVFRADWNGYDSFNQIVPDGDYYYIISVTAGTQNTQARGNITVGSRVTTGNCAGFTDVDADDPLCPAVEFVKERGIFAGYGDGTIGLDRMIQRAQLLTVVAKAFKFPLDSYNPTIDGDLGYPDLKKKKNKWYMPYLKTFARLGLMVGYMDGKMRPERTMSTAELYLVFLKSAKNSPQKIDHFSLSKHVWSAPYEDTPVNESTFWYIKYAAFAHLNDLVPGRLFHPKRGITRGQVIQLIWDTHLKGLISYGPPTQ